MSSTDRPHAVHVVQLGSFPPAAVAAAAAAVAAATLSLSLFGSVGTRSTATGRPSAQHTHLTYIFRGMPGPLGRAHIPTFALSARLSMQKRETRATCVYVFQARSFALSHCIGIGSSLAHNPPSHHHHYNHHQNRHRQCQAQSSTSTHTAAGAHGERVRLWRASPNTRTHTHAHTPTEQ